MCWEEALNTVVQVAWHPVGLVWFRVSGPSLRLVFLVDPVKNVAVPSAFFRLFSEIFCIFRFFRSYLGYGTNQTGGDSLGLHFSDQTNELRGSQTAFKWVPLTNTGPSHWLDTHNHIHRHKSFSSIEYEKSLPFCCHICCFRFPPTAAQTSSLPSSHFGWDFSFSLFLPIFVFFFFLPARAICSKAANSSLILFCAWAFLLLHFLTFFFLDSIAIFYVWAEQFLPGFHVKQFPLLTYKFLKYFTKINVGLLAFWGIAPALSVWTPVQETH